MKIEVKYKPELIASKDETRGHICSPYLDAVAKKMVATDGHRMIVVPVDVEADTSGHIGKEVLAEGRKLAKKARLAEVEIEGKTRTGGRTFPPVASTANFPAWQQVDAKFAEGDKDTLTFGLNARYLKELADALGSDDGCVVLTIKKNGDTFEPIIVRERQNKGKTRPEAYAILMQTVVK